MSQRHVNLLMEAVSLNISDEFLCNRIGIITGWITHYPNLTNIIYSQVDYVDLVKVIQENIDSNLYNLSGKGYTFSATTFYKQGMTRKQWAEEILAPLALEIVVE